MDYIVYSLGGSVIYYIKDYTTDSSGNINGYTTTTDIDLAWTGTQTQTQWIVDQLGSEFWGTKPKPH